MTGTAASLETRGNLGHERMHGHRGAIRPVRHNAARADDVAAFARAPPAAAVRAVPSKKQEGAA